MLNAITFASFKSYQSARLPLSPLTVLIGANAAGKSNAIEAMRLLAWLAQGQKLSSIQYLVENTDRIVRGRTIDLSFRRTGQFGLGCETSTPDWNNLSMEISLREDGLHITKEHISSNESNIPLYTIDQQSTGNNTDVSVAYNNFARGRNKPHIRCSDQFAIFTQLTSAATLNAQHKQSQEIIPQIARTYEQWLSAMLFLDPAPAKMRDYAFPSEKRLQGDGSNLSGVLYNLWGNDNEAVVEPYATQRFEILNFIKSLPEQDIEEINFLMEPRGGVMVQLKETFGGDKREYDASLLSDGTLRVLAIVAAMLSADEGSLVVIEEIDNGVHPSRARHLLEGIRKIADRRRLRVLLSTHNPAMTDALPDASIQDVVYCYRSPADGASKLVQLKDLPDFPELVAQGPLGQLMTAGILERFVKQQRSADERKALAHAWLNKIRNKAEQ
jgi:predicted ATPase